MAKLGQIKSGTMRVGNTTASGYGIVYADEVIGHRRVNTYAELKSLPTWCLYNKAGGDNINTAIGQLWYVFNGDSSHPAGLYQLVGTDISLDSSWKLFKNGADVSTHDTTYTFTNGSNGSFTVTPKGGSAQTVSIGKPSTAGTADHAKTADSAVKANSATSATSATNANHATSADSATSATKATQDKNGRDIVNTYATKSEISALTSALVYKGTIGTKGTITTTNVAAKVGDVYVAVDGAPSVNGVALEAGDMIIAKTAGDGTTTQPTWTAVQTNINGAVTAANTLDSSMLIVGSGNKAIHAAGGTGFVKITNGIVSADNSTYLTTTSASSTYATKTELNGKVDKVTGKGLSTNDFTTAEKNKLKNIAENANNYSLPKATTDALGGGKVVNVYSKTAALTNTDPDASNVTLYGLQIDKDGNFYTPVKNAAAYSLPVAANNTLGGIKIGFAEDNTNKNYPVQLSDNKAYVHVPWTDTNTTYPLASTSANGLMSNTDKKKLDNIQNPTVITTAQLDLCGYANATSLVNAVANQKDGLSFFVADQNAIVTLQTDNGKHAIIQTIRTATELNGSWEFVTGVESSHTDGVLFTYQRFYPIGGTYSTNTHNKWTKWAIIDVDTMYTADRSNVNSIYKSLGKQLFSSLNVDDSGKITFSSIYSGTSVAGIKSQSKDILTPISNTAITTLFN